MMLSFYCLVALLMLSGFTSSQPQSCDGNDNTSTCISTTNKLRITPDAIMRKHGLIFVFTETLLELVGTKFVWNGKVYREEHGFSGSHGAIVYLAEALASRGHHVYFVSNMVAPLTYNGVIYVKERDVEEIQCDVFMVTFHAKDLQLMDRIPFTTKKIGMVLGCAPNMLGHCNFHTIDIDRFVFLQVSYYVQFNSFKDEPWMLQYENKVMHNSLNISELLTTRIATSTAISPYSGAKYATSIDMSQKQNQFVFFPCFERGGHVSFEVAKHFPHFKFLISSYAHTPELLASAFTNDPYNQAIIPIKRSRNDIFGHLLSSKYFVYSLYDPVRDGYITKDTFGYVVLEALLHGVIVILPRVGGYQELFGDAIAYIEVDDLVPKELLYRWHTKLPILGSDTVIQRFVSKIEELERDSTLAQSYIEKGLKLAEKYDNGRIAAGLEKYMTQELLRLELDIHSTLPA